MLVVGVTSSELASLSHRGVVVLRAGRVLPKDDLEAFARKAFGEHIMGNAAMPMGNPDGLVPQFDFSPEARLGGRPVLLLTRV